ncbi:hypothetical protein TRFO_22562 [Tritrichomonas foetus]|uniref:E2F/DP family winged-helix DNA-binding domain-containing protein n=1 Tax=Tritrichomonas foetus TaxID=1144522 RepID=A0A1J4KCZ5_9EUKA|nr:hypothetical protein TRFO_22562 [Tritrichomonas foetus]|eukprot:OHT08808.1 hypothetical protein TRFO_22562 [Tritrichomonas foetus]
MEGNSLKSIAQRLIVELQKESGKEISINDIEEKLQVNKRRICDVINILVGAGLVKKLSKSKIVWNSCSESNSSQNKYQRYEERVDKRINERNRELIDLMESNLFKQFGYLTCEDVAKLASSSNAVFLAPHEIPPYIYTTVQYDSKNEIKCKIHYKTEGQIVNKS